jgi:hypothetical protein
VASGPAVAGVDECRETAAKLAGAFAKKRAKHLLLCASDPACDDEALARKLRRLRARSREALTASCATVAATDMGFGSYCPDPTGRCTQALDSSQALADCIYCMVSETVEPLLRRLQGSTADLGETCGGCAASACSPDAFCEPPPGTCEPASEVGLCVEIPDACPEIFAPVCGCDGTTYENDCLRRRARVGLLHEGACPGRCTSADGTTCPPGTFCDGPPGFCNEPVPGSCTPVPDDCPELEQPVCGCDGTTYANDCERRRAGARLLHHGPCQTGCGLVDPTNAGDLPTLAGCPDGTFCELPAGTCERGLGEGSCVPIPGACPDNVAPVCGCDGETYFNDCERMAAGVAKRHDGACKDVCGGIVGRGCAEGQVCDLPPGECQSADLEGHCRARPEYCAQYFDPVCGCDGITYSNDCARLSAGVQLAHFGPCFARCAPDGEACPEGTICLPRPGTCDPASGVCTPVSETCPLLAAPFPLLAVCGCDGETYDSLCSAVEAGVGVAHEGTCDDSERCITDADCPSGLACIPVPGLCWLVAGPVAPAECVEIPEACPAVIDPVCGCDGKSYDSECEALRSHAGVAHAGSCQAGVVQ